MEMEVPLQVLLAFFYEAAGITISNKQGAKFLRSLPEGGSLMPLVRGYTLGAHFGWP